MTKNFPKEKRQKKTLARINGLMSKLIYSLKVDFCASGIENPTYLKPKWLKTAFK